MESPRRVSFVETIAEEERGRAYDINAIAPGAINTRLTDEVIALGPKVVGEALPRLNKKRVRCVTRKSPWAGRMAPVLCERRHLRAAAAAPWDPWPTLATHAHELAGTDIYTLRRIIPEERGKQW